MLKSRVSAWGMYVRSVYIHVAGASLYLASSTGVMVPSASFLLLQLVMQLISKFRIESNNVLKDIKPQAVRTLYLDYNTLDSTVSNALFVCYINDLRSLDYRRKLPRMQP